MNGERIEFIRAVVRPILLFSATGILAYLTIAGIESSFNVVWQSLVVGGWVWYFGERTLTKLLNNKNGGS